MDLQGASLQRDLSPVNAQQQSQSTHSTIANLSPAQAQQPSRISMNKETGHDIANHSNDLTALQERGYKRPGGEDDDLNRSSSSGNNSPSPLKGKKMDAALLLFFNRNSSEQKTLVSVRFNQHVDVDDFNRVRNILGFPSVSDPESYGPTLGGSVNKKQLRELVENKAVLRVSKARTLSLLVEGSSDSSILSTY